MSKAGRRPTEAEIAILAVLWERGPATVRDVHAALEPERGTGYTTVLKLMQIMAAKGLVRRDESKRSHVYSAAAQREVTQATLVGDLAERAFGGSTSELVMRALCSRMTDPMELEEIREMLDELLVREKEGRR